TANDLTLNQVPPELMGPGDTQQVRPFPRFSNVTLINPSIGNSSYYASCIRVQKRITNGFSLLAHYTRSRYYDDAESANEFGNTPRSVLRGPGLATTDLTLEKSFPLPAGKKFDVRAEVYNLLNRTNFNIPGFTLGAADFGVISSARSARTVQLGARLSF